MTAAVAGQYQFADRALAVAAEALLDDTGAIHVNRTDVQQGLKYAAAGQFVVESAVPGLPQEVVFEDNARFIPADVHWRWLVAGRRQCIPEWLESRWLVVLVAALAVPLCLWWVTFRGIPALAQTTVEWLPVQVSQQVGQHTLQVLDSLHFELSSLPLPQQQQLRVHWQQVLERLQLEPAQYPLIFRTGDMGANAFALPDGTVLVTDQMVDLTASDVDALIAVMLHEIGHVEYQHGMQLMARSAATSVLFGLLFGDIEGSSELLLGAGTGLLENAFSREMERQADDFAIARLQQLGRSPLDFARAMRLLMASHADDPLSTDQPGWQQYLSSHPATLERIEAAEQAGAAAADAAASCINCD